MNIQPQDVNPDAAQTSGTAPTSGVAAHEAVLWRLIDLLTSDTAIEVVPLANGRKALHASTVMALAHLFATDGELAELFAARHAAIEREGGAA